MNNYRELSPALAKKAKDDLNEDPNRIIEEVEILRNWILRQPHLRARTNTQYLLSFLRGCKHSLEKTKKKLDNFYSMRTLLPELYTNRFADDPTILAIAKLGVLYGSPQMIGDDGPRIVIVRPGAYDPTKYKMADVLRLGFMFADIILMEDDTTFVAGHIELFDLANVTAQHFFDLQPLFIKKLVTFSERALPIRQKGMHFFNAPAGFDTFFNMMKGFLNEDRKNKYFIHGNMESLYKFIPKQLLPAEYGGSNGCIQDQIDYWEQKILEYRDFFVEDSKLGSDEKLRIGEPLNPESVFGISGTFRKLDFD